MFVKRLVWCKNQDSRVNLKRCLAICVRNRLMRKCVYVARFVRDIDVTVAA